MRKDPNANRLSRPALLNETEIHGNSQADVLAKQGANIYALDEQVLDAIQRRTAITMLVQNMMVIIWTQKRQNEKDAKDALALTLAAEDIPCEFNLVDQQVDYNNDDYDPFGNGMCNADGEDIPNDTSTIPTPTHPEYFTPEIQAKYPGYVWHMPFDENDEDIDLGLTILTPDPCVLMRSKPT